MEFSELSSDIRSAIKIEALSRTSYLKLYTVFDDEYEKSLDIAKSLLEKPDEKLADAILGAYDRVKSYYTGTINGTRPSTTEYNVIWGRIYVWLYFLKHDEPVWKEYLFPLMKERKMPANIMEDVNRCEKFLDEYIEKRKRFNTALQQKNNPKKSKQAPLDGGISPFYIAEGSKTDVMKVLFYLYDQNVFVDSNGQSLKRKKSEFMKAIGAFLNSDFSNYSQRINAAAAEPNFPDILERMLKDAQQKYADEFK